MDARYCYYLFSMRDGDSSSSSIPSEEASSADIDIAWETFGCSNDTACDYDPNSQRPGPQVQFTRPEGCPPPEPPPPSQEVVIAVSVSFIDPIIECCNFYYILDKPRTKKEEICRCRGG